MQLNKTENLRQAQQLIDQGRVSSAIPLYQKIVDSDSSDLAAISVLNDLYVKAGRISEAVEHFLRIGENYLGSGSTNSAAHILNKVLKLDPANAPAHMNFGKVYLHEGKIDRAHACFIEAGAAFWHKGNIGAAIKMNEQALAIMPNSRQAVTALKLLQQSIDQPEEPPQPKPTKPIAVELEPILISIPDESDEPRAAEAIPDSKLELEAASDFSDPLLRQEFPQHAGEDAIIEQIARAEMLVGYGEVDLAISLLREALIDRPDHVEIRAKLKDIYLRSEMTDRASEECVNIAGIYAARGETNRARDYTIRARLLLSQSVEPIATPAIMQDSGVDKAEEVQETSLEWAVDMRQPVRVM